MSLPASSARLRTELGLKGSPAALQRFSETCASLRAEPKLERFLAAFAEAARLVGRAPLAPDAGELIVAQARIPLSAWSADVVARVLLLLEVAESAPALLEQALWSAYGEGDTLEKVAVIRALPLLEGAERFVQLSLDAGRTNDARLFTAVACDTPYPAQHYPELEWNKLFMKAAFVRAPLSRIMGLSERENPELARMALEYIEEQESAGRSFAPELWRAIAPFPRLGALAKMLGYASHASADARLGAVQGLARARDERSESFLLERLSIETHEAVRAALLDALAKIQQSPQRSAVR